MIKMNLESGKYSDSHKKMASYLYRTATTIYPCCIPALGRFNRSWPYKTCRRKGIQLFVF